ncbi:uncharacterized protein F4822DRAFT_401699 [Hypoxylon trugodes]|uniref:uncharacterized protein n=1 Tax=Hypoxylon trugodes TaxID=326681 RepID=UPI002195E4E2|nr:uncharacterized protein F4822DRAFT_401699 [Hypoxylon trugodes]KAI1390369.1 hypothetical protein F4822DRAFT_401699 [Hypoxylon trugodes]
MDNEEIPTVQDVINFARENTNYYQNLHHDVQQDNPDLEDVPTIRARHYWALARIDPSHVLTRPFTEGKVYCTDNSASDISNVYLTKDEVRDLAREKAILWSKALNLAKGDRIVNIMAPRDLQVGFWEMANLFNGVYAPAESAQLLISNERSEPQITREIIGFNTNVIFGDMSDLTRIVQHCSRYHITMQSVAIILYLGRTVPKAFHSVWLTVFPNAKLFAPLYDKIDLGPLGVPAPITTSEGCDIDPTYKVCERVAKLEIMADDGTIIKQPGIKGNVVITHLMRRLQPIIRYPLGDVAEWVDYESQTFKYYGRESLKIELANITLDWAYVKNIVDSAVGTDVTSQFQCVLRCHGSGEKLIIRLALEKPGNAGEVRHRIEKALWRDFSKWRYHRELGDILSIRMEWSDDGQLERDERTGALRDIVDERYGDL